MMSLPWGASPPRVVPARRAEGLFSRSPRASGLSVNLLTDARGSVATGRGLYGTLDPSEFERAADRRRGALVPLAKCKETR